MKRLSLCRTLLWTLSAGCFLALSAAGQITKDVDGTGNPSIDPGAVQDAIDFVGADGTVVLKGNFSFGDNDGVQIVKPNVTLKGYVDPTTGIADATITGGGKLHTTLTLPPPFLPNHFVRYVISVEAVGVKISGITINTAGMAGIVVVTNSTNPADNPITIEKNTVTAPTVPSPTPRTEAFAFFARWTGCPIKVIGNTLSASQALWAYENTGDVTVTGNKITGNKFGTYIMLNTRNCIVSDNRVYGGPEGQGLHVCTTPGYGQITITDNKVFGAMFGIGVHDLGTVNHDLAAQISNNYVEPSIVSPAAYGVTGVRAWMNYAPVNILNNKIRVIADRPGDNPVNYQFGVWVHSWSLFQGGVVNLNQDNPPVMIKGNDVEIRYPFPEQPNWALQACGIVVGYFNSGINNVTVESNKLSGTATRGVFTNSYSRNNLIARNDLSGLRTWDAQMYLMSRETVVKENILGFANRIPGYSYGVALLSVDPVGASTTMPYPTENCTLSKNNYRNTGLPGWANGGSGCVILFSAADMDWVGTEVKNNLVFESGMFPVGTGGAKEQVYEYKTSSGLVHDNRIVGLPANEIADPGIGRRLKAIGGHLGNATGEMSQQCGIEDGSLAKGPGSSPVISPDVLPPLPSSTPELYGNYPNPFNPSTSIQYGLSKASHVRIEVFNSLGQVVARLVDCEQPAGNHEVRFNASGMASGMYVYRLQAGSLVQSRTMLLVR